jgi:hypothetical protein
MGTDHVKPQRTAMDLIDDLLAELAELGVAGAPLEIAGRRVRQRWHNCRVEVRTTSAAQAKAIHTQVRALIDAGVPRRTAYRKVTGR